MDFVRMKHPDIDGLSGEVTREAFEQVHSRKGWVLATDKDLAAHEEAELAGTIDGTDTADGSGTTTATAPAKATTANKNPGS